MAMADPESGGEAVSAALLPAWLRGLRRLLDLISQVLLAIAIVVLVLIFVLMNTEIVTRYLFGASTLIADEYTGYGFAIVILSGLMYAHRSGALLRVDFGVNLLGSGWRTGALVLASLASLALASFSAYAGYRAWALSWLFNSSSSFTSATPLWIPQIAMPIGFVLLAVSFAEEAVSRLYGVDRRSA